MKYYFYIDNNKINGKGQCEDDTAVEVSQEMYNDDIDRYIWNGSEIVLDPDYEEKQAQKERERIGNLTMTPLDFITVLTQFGLSLEQISTFLESNLTIKMQLTYCNLVYCGVVKQFLPISIGDITITDAMVEQAFKIKNGEL